MKRMAIWMSATVLGCGSPAANCEVEVNGVPVCVEGATALNHCRSEWGGEPTRADSSDDPTCRQLGYSEACDTRLTEVGDGFTSSHSFLATTAEDCDVAAGGQVGGS